MAMEEEGEKQGSFAIGGLVLCVLSFEIFLYFFSFAGREID